MSTPAPRPSTLAELARTALAGRGARDAFLAHREGSWVGIPGRDAFDTVRRLAAGLAERGIGPGDRVALLSWNRVEWMLSDLAITSSGAVTVPIYPNVPYSQVRDILRSSGARLVLAENTEQWEKVDRVRSECPALQGAVVFQRWGVPDEVADLASVERAGEERLAREPDLWERRAAAVTPDSLATLIYTSGTTGIPKGVMLTHENLCSNVDACLERLTIVPEDLAMSFLPLAHIFERTVELIYLTAGARIAYARSIEGLAEDLLAVSPTVMASVPRVLEKIRSRTEAVIDGLPAPLRAASRWSLRVALERGDRVRAGRSLGPWLALRAAIADALVLRRIREQLGGRVSWIISGGAALPPDVGRFFWGAGAPVVEGYGLTETSPVIAVNAMERCRMGTVGPPLHNVEVRLEEDGEVLARGPSISQGYWRLPEATAEAFVDGWFRTGDLGAFDEKGYLRITGRKKEILVTSGGKNVAPVRVEARLQESPIVERAVVIGDGRPYLVALLVAAEGVLERIAAEEGLGGDPAVHQHPAVLERFREELDRCQADLASYETIKRFALLERDLTVDEGLLTPTLKVRRGEVDRVFAETVQRLYS